ncbi:CHASE2 domain-containing protein [Sneathiella marina]|uniref:CHASE2 domain-containing protein n=1 Tax=Sneathiella marina TaxID=2950108 RepID=A0ABY4W6H8_9PROT|nr:CHASE2 domain-containing protein [Sneathiella marina]USG61517.1 CHASE2 domain-containing protein [Sneathiella marina]
MAQRLPVPISRLSQAMIVLGICAAIVVGFINARHLLVLRQAEDQLLSARFMVRGPIPADRNIQIVVLEEERLTTPSVILTNVTKAIEHLTENENSIIVFDQTLMDRITASNFTGNDPALSDAFISALSKSDRILTPYRFTLDSGDRTDIPEAINETAYRVYRFRDDTAPQLPLNPQAVVAPSREILAVTTPGHETFIDDGTMYRQFAYPVLGYKGEYLPSLAVEAATSFMNIAPTDVSVFFGSGLQIGSNYIPTDSSMQMALNYRGPVGSYQYRTLSEILETPNSKDKFGIVLLGAVTADQQATSVTPFDRTLPNIEVLATSIDNLLNADPLDRSQQVIILDIILIAIVGVFFALLATLRSGLVVLTLGVLMGALITVLNFKAFTLINLGLNLTFPLGTVILCAVYLFIAKKVTNRRLQVIEEAEKKDTSKYAAPWIAERVRKAKNVIAAEEAAAAAEEEAALAKAMEMQSAEEELVLTDVVLVTEEDIESSRSSKPLDAEEDILETAEPDVVEEPLFLRKPTTTETLHLSGVEEVEPAIPSEPAELSPVEAVVDTTQQEEADEVMDDVETAFVEVTKATVSEVVEESAEEADVPVDVVTDENPEIAPVSVTPPGLAEPANEDLAASGDEREKTDAAYHFDVALLFVDLTGYEAANSVLGPTRLAQIRHSLQGIVEATVSRYAGYANSFGGDGVIGIFGLPDAHMNDSINALQCARDLTEEIAQWRSNQALPEEVDLKFGIGMHYGQLSIEDSDAFNDGQLSIKGEAISVVSHLEKMSITHSKAVIASDAIVDEILTVGTSNELLNGFRPLPLQDVQSNGSRQRVWQWDGPDSTASS